MLASAILTMTGCGKHEGPHLEENKKVLSEYVSGGTTASDGIDEIVRLLEEIEPGCRVISAEENDDYFMKIKTDTGNEYGVDTSPDGWVFIRLTDKDSNITNKKMINEAVNIKEQHVDEIVRLLEEIEPGCRFLSVEETGELDGGYLIDIKTYSGNEYTVNTSTDGEIGNITNKNTGEMLYPSDQYPGEDDDSDEPIAADVNTSFLMEKGISKENARKIAEAVDHAAPNELIDRVEGYNPSEIDIKITVYMETGKIFYVTVTEEDGWNATILDSSL